MSFVLVSLSGVVLFLIRNRATGAISSLQFVFVRESLPSQKMKPENGLYNRERTITIEKQNGEKNTLSLIPTGPIGVGRQLGGFCAWSSVFAF